MSRSEIKSIPVGCYKKAQGFNNKLKECIFKTLDWVKRNFSWAVKEKIDDKDLTLEWFYAFATRVLIY